MSYKSFDQMNSSLFIIKKILDISFHHLGFRPNIFGDNDYLIEFPSLIIFLETLLLILLLLKTIVIKENRKKTYIECFILLIVFCFMYKFLDQSLILFVPG